MQRLVPEAEPWDAEDLPRRLRDPRNPYAELAARSNEIALRAAENMREQGLDGAWIERVLLDAGYDEQAARAHARHRRWHWFRRRLAQRVRGWWEAWRGPGDGAA